MKASVQGQGGSNVVQNPGSNVVVFPNRLNILYRGVENPLSVCAPRYRPSELILSMTNGTINRKGDDQFIAMPGSGNTSVVTVRGQSGRRLGKVKFRVRDVPSPRITLGGYTRADSSISQSALGSVGKVSMDQGNFLFPAQFSIVQFEIGARVGGQFPTEMKRGGGRLSRRQKRLLDNVGRGSRVEVREIIVRDPNGKERHVESLTLRVR
ncbi:MAG: GldM family protein [Flavobacteriales bacterium]